MSSESDRGKLCNEEMDLIGEVSKLNNELANLTRELTKKNLALEQANNKINELLRTDPLTGIANRLHLMEYFEKVHAAAVRHSYPLSLIMADLDDFKLINDQYGHQTGDSVLRAFANILNQNSRAEDLAARYGGGRIPDSFTLH